MPLRKTDRPSGGHWSNHSRPHGRVVAGLWPELRGKAGILPPVLVAKTDLCPGPFQLQISAPDTLPFG